MASQDKTYPDISDILARKEEGRRARARMSFAEKLAALDALRARSLPIVKAREERKKQNAPSRSAK
jgi:hypothetical protein